MEKNADFNDLMNKTIYWIKGYLEVSYYFTYYFYTVCYFPRLDGAVKIWVFEEFESEWGLEIRKIKSMGKIGK